MSALFASAAVQQQHALSFVDRCMTLASAALLFYDYALTLGAEAERYWAAGAPTWPAALFFLTRYLALPAQAPLVLQAFWHAPVQSCKDLQLFHQMYAGVSQGLVAALLALRVWALYDRARWVLGLLFGVAAVVIGIGMWSILGTRSQHASTLDDIGCNLGLSTTAGTRLGITWIGVLLFDAVVMILTLRRGLSAWKIGESGAHTLFHVLVRDGILYFGAIAFVHLANILCMMLAPPIAKSASTNFTNVIATALICRLMLNIRDPSVRAGSSGDRTTTGGTYLTSVVGGPEDAEWATRTEKIDGGAEERGLPNQAPEVVPERTTDIEMNVRQQL